MSKRIFLSPPHMNGHEMLYIQDAFDTNWIAPLGKNVDRLELLLKEYIGRNQAVALSCGTAAIHLALKYLGVKQNDTVFCSDLTFAGSCNPILYLNARPVFIDSDRKTWNMSAVALKRALSDAQANGELPKAVIIVDLYGIPAQYDELLPICQSYGVPLIEDAAEALGSTYQGKKCGSFGTFGILSFNANKIITTSGGGMVLCDDEAAAQKIKFWATQSREPSLYYEHKEVGFNYRLSNISAGIGCGQVESLDAFVQKRRYINKRYRELLSMLPVGFEPVFDGAESNCWLTVITIDDGATEDVSQIITALSKNDIESRPFWKPMHNQPVFCMYPFYPHDEKESVSEALFQKGLCLPSGTALTDEDLERIASIVKSCFKQRKYVGKAAMDTDLDAPPLLISNG